uniref:DNA damage-inducible transcript 3 protein n=1 Tax=Jaagichlorella roystonensis TaxID=1052852 RepID=A0A6C0MBB7_9CHLO|nr:DNA damage-inducible transcript 3 protein [Jaagichlorella roystonensis]QHU78318.1 DNA damage-inducible transcript 3 protein [Jaagichlorella roystonensis]
MMHHSEAIIDHGSAKMRSSVGGIDYLINQVMQKSQALIDRSSREMMQQSKALIDRMINQVMHPSRGGIDHSSSGGVMHCCVTTIDHGTAMMQQSEALIDHFFPKNDASLCNNDRSWLRHDASLPP